MIFKSAWRPKPRMSRSFGCASGSSVMSPIRKRFMTGLPRNFDGFVKSPSAPLRFNFVVAAYL